MFKDGGDLPTSKVPLEVARVYTDERPGRGGCWGAEDQAERRVSPLPSTIRVDAMTARTSRTRRSSRLLCEDPGYVAAAPFDEIRSIRYGRMAREDGQTIMFANPQDATG